MKDTAPWVTSFSNFVLALKLFDQSNMLCVANKELLNKRKIPKYLQWDYVYPRSYEKLKCSPGNVKIVKNISQIIMWAT